MMSEQGYVPEADEVKRQSGIRKKSEQADRGAEKRPTMEERVDAAIEHEDDGVVTSAPTAEDALAAFKRKNEAEKEKRIEAMEQRVDKALEDEEKAEHYGEIVESASSAESLKEVVDMIGIIEASDGTKMTAKEINGWIDMAVKFPDSVSLNTITRKFGLRNKVKELIKDAAARKEEKIEEAVMFRGDSVSKAHEQGKTLKPLETEAHGAHGAALQEMTREQEQKAFESLPKVGALKEQLSRAERLLESLGVKNVDTFMSERAIAGGIGKAKDLFGGLFNKKKRELNRAADLYQDILRHYNFAVDDVEKNLPLTPDQQAIKRIQAEGKR